MSPSAVSGAALLVALCLVVRSGDAVASAQASSQDARALFAAARAAYDRRDYREYLHNLKKAADLRPTHPILLHRLAGAYALNHRPAETAGALRTLAALRLYSDVTSDPDFAAVVNDPTVKEAIEALNQVRSLRIGDAQVAWTIPDPSFIPEGIAVDSATQSFYVSSQYRRKIVRIDRQGAVTDFVGEGQDGLWMVFGIAVDPARRWLWAVSTSEPVMRGFTAGDENRAGLFAFVLTGGKLQAKTFAVGLETVRRYFDDVAVSPDGRVFVSDGGAGAIRTLAPGATELTTLVEPGTIQGPNGIAVVPSGRTLFVSDYAGFIFRIDAATGATRRLDAPRDAVLYGIDGLCWYEGDLIGVQNGVSPARVVKLRLSSDQMAIRQVEILEMNHPLVSEPTIGVVADKTFYWVANSHGGVLRRPGVKIETEELTLPTILKIPLGTPGP